MRVYVIFAEEDRVLFEAIRAELAQHNIVTTTSSMLLDAINWAQTITRAIAESDAVVVLLSNTLAQSDAMREIQIATQSNGQLIAVDPLTDPNLGQSATFSKYAIVSRYDLVDFLLTLSSADKAPATRGGDFHPTTRSSTDLFTKTPSVPGDVVELEILTSEEPGASKEAMEELASGDKSTESNMPDDSLAFRDVSPPKTVEEEEAKSPRPDRPSPAQVDPDPKTPPQRRGTPPITGMASVPPIPSPQSQPQSSVNVEVDGDVSGQVTIAGGDVHVHQTVTPEEEKRNQPRKFEAAFPQETHKGIEEKLWVAVRLPDAPSPFAEEKKRTIAETEAVDVPLPVDRKTGELKPVDVEITVTAPHFKIVGDNKKTLTVWPDGRTVKRWFMLEPLEEGSQEIMLEISYEGRLLAEIDLKTYIFAPEKKARSLLNLSLQIASFSLQVSFAGT